MPQSNKVQVKVARKSGFDKSHFSLVPAKVGTEVPILVDEVIGNTTVHLGLKLGASMPPLATDTYMNADICVEAFFVPFRILYGGFEAFFNQNTIPVINSEGRIAGDGNNSSWIQQAHVVMPSITLDVSRWSESQFERYIGSMSLSDYLGIKGYAQLSSGSEFENLNPLVRIQPLPYVAYHMIYQNFYRNSEVSTEYFVKYNINTNCGGVVNTHWFATLPSSVYFDEDYASSRGLDDNCSYAYRIINPDSTDCLLADSTSIFALRQRCFGFDYFTNAFPNPQWGDAMSVDTSGSTTTIAQIRAGESLQEFKERQNYAGSRYEDNLRARFGASLSAGLAQRPVFLGSARYNVYSKTVDVTAQNSSDPISAQNPFAENAGARMGNGFAAGSDLLINGFTAQEPGYIFVLAALVPTAAYSTGVRRYLRRYTSGTSGDITEMANHQLQNIGNQPIYKYELDGDLSNPNEQSGIFGYTDRFADFMTFPSEIHGDFLLGRSLSAFAAQRGFSAWGQQTTPSINTTFLEIPTNYLDNVTAVTEQLSRYGYWMEIMFDYKVSMPLAKYSVPSMVDVAAEHGETITLHRGGFRF